MSHHDEHLEELMRQCATATPLQRLANAEQRVVFRWLIDGGHMTRTGKPLEAPRQMPTAPKNKPDGTPIYAPGADFSPTRTITMQR